MRWIQVALVTVVLIFAGASPIWGADDGTDNLRIKYDDKMEAAEKSEHSPVMQYALAGIVVLSVLVVVCKPSRKAY
jgi:hypothetical protein